MLAPILQDYQGKGGGFLNKEQFDRLIESGIVDKVLDTSYDGLTYTDENGNIAYVNKAYCELTGFGEDGILGHSIYDLVKIGRPLSRMAIEVFRTRKAVSEVISYREATGHEVMVTVAPVYDDAGQFRGMVANLRDMTELTDMRREMEVTHLRFDEELKKQEEANRDLRRRLNELQLNLKDYNIVGESRQMRNLMELAYRICSVKSTVLITGESGVGKDVFCRMVHKFGGEDRPYIKISCGAIPDNLLESELFGYEPGAFTGAGRNGKPGIFELASGGSVFLDEIGEMPLNLQVKLLTVLQDRKFFRLGGTKELKMSARVMAATNRDLKEEVAAGRFRQDLYYRLNVIPVHIPPLRERKEDILPLADHILARLSQAHGVRKVLGPELQNVLKAYDWPGNIRELNNVIERIYVLSPGELLGTEYLPEELSPLSARTGILLQKRGTLRETMEQAEAAVLQQHLRDELTLREIAGELDISVATLVRKMTRYKLPKRYQRSAGEPR
ncbi:MAG: PAS domain S-box protein [Clostridia bacterium]|nr:PAS domain S-box protein [Clostridia bacterium]